MILFAAICGALAVFMAVYTLATPGRAFAARLEQFQRDATLDREALLAQPFTLRVGAPLFRRIRRLGQRILPGSILEAIQGRLIVAGEPMTLHGFVTFELTMAALAAIGVVYFVSRKPTLLVTGLALAAALLLMTLPLDWLRLKVNARKSAILKALPDAVDLIVTSVEAGLAIDAALSQVGQDTRGPLGDELKLTVRETALGRSRRDALQNMIDRTQVAELKTFVQAIIQAEQTGIPIGQVLRTQVGQIRIRRRQRAEAQAQRAPVKMVLVLVLFVLPALIITVLGPVVMRISGTL